MSNIVYDRLIGPTSTNSGSDQTTTSLTVSLETAPTTISALSYGNFVVQVSSPGSTGPVTPATCTDTQANTYTLLKEVQFAGYALDVFSHVATTVNPASTITTTHQPSKQRIILSDEWYNLGSYEKVASAFAATPTADVNLGSFHVGKKEWLVYAVLALGGSPHSIGVSISDGWNLLHDTGSNLSSGIDVRLIVAYQIVAKRTKVEFTPVLSTTSLWGGAMFSYKPK